MQTEESPKVEKLIRRIVASDKFAEIAASQFIVLLENSRYMISRPELFALTPDQVGVNSYWLC